MIKLLCVFILFFLSFLKFFILSESTKLNAHLTGTKFPHAGLLFPMLGHILHSPVILSGVFYTLDSRTGICGANSVQHGQGQLPCLTDSVADRDGKPCPGCTHCTRIGTRKSGERVISCLSYKLYFSFPLLSAT